MKFVSVNAGYGYAVRLEAGEPVIGTLTAFAEKEGIDGAFFYGLGAVEKASVGYYDLDSKEYKFLDYPDRYEVVSIKGNFGFKDGGSFVHAHVVLSDAENQTFGGHLNEAVVSATLELFIHDVQGSNMNRIHDNNTGLSLLEIT